MIYRKMKAEEAELIKTIDATCFIKNAWRMVNGTLQLVEINWTDRELPNGLPWHLDRFRETIEDGGTAFGCFEGEVLHGYATVNCELFGEQFRYCLLDQLFVDQNDRGKGIGRQLVKLCCEEAKKFGADKLYICAGSSENTIAFYKKLGCVNAVEINRELAEEDERDIQLELGL